MKTFKKNLEEKQFEFIPSIYQPFINDYQTLAVVLNELVNQDQFEAAEYIKDEMETMVHSFKVELIIYGYSVEDAEEVANIITKNSKRVILNIPA